CKSRPSPNGTAKVIKNPKTANKMPGKIRVKFCLVLLPVLFGLGSAKMQPLNLISKSKPGKIFCQSSFSFTGSEIHHISILVPLLGSQRCTIFFNSKSQI